MVRSNIVVFDIDGTLTDSVKAHQSAFEGALRSFDFPSLRTDWGSYKHHSDSAIFTEAWHEAGRNGDADLDRLEAEYAWRYDKAVCAAPFFEIPGAGRFVDYLRAEGWAIAFATGSLRHGAIHKLSIAGIDGREEIVVSASELETREAIVARAGELACKATRQNTPGRVVSIGDGIWDLKTACNLGYEFIGIGFAGKGVALEELGARVYQDFGKLMAEGLDAFAIKRRSRR